LVLFEFGISIVDDNYTYYYAGFALEFETKTLFASNGYKKFREI